MGQSGRKNALCKPQIFLEKSFYKDLAAKAAGIQPR
jgi:hypothetical protein